MPNFSFGAKIYPACPEELNIYGEKSNTSDLNCDWNAVASDVAKVLSSQSIRDENGNSIFYGFNSWHNSVHAYSSLVTIFNTFDNSSHAVFQQLLDLFSSTFTSVRVKEEIKSMNASESWMTPYSLCRFAKFISVLHSCPPKHHEWIRIFSPILNEVDKLLTQWIFDLQVAAATAPDGSVDKTSSVNNTAHCLLLLLHAAQAGVCSQLFLPACDVAFKLYGRAANLTDTDSDLSVVSSPLCVALLMTRLHELGRVPSDCMNPSMLTWLNSSVHPSVWGHMAPLGPNGQDDDEFVSRPESDMTLRLQCVAGIIRSRYMADIASVVISAWNIDLSGLPHDTSVDGADEYTRDELTSVLLSSAVTLYRSCMQNLLATRHWLETEVFCHALDTCEALHRISLAITINDTWLKLASCLRNTSTHHTTCDPALPVADCATRDWRNVKVWIAGSPRDTALERAVLMDNVFPALSKWAEPMRLRCIPVDGSCDLLATNHNIADAMTSCMRDNGGSLVMLSLLGNTYGSMESSDIATPVCTKPEEDIAEDTESNSDSRSQNQDISALHMQIAHGAIKHSNPNALFFIRRANTCHGNVTVDCSESFLNSERLRHLKHHVRRAFAKSAVLEYEYEADLSLVSFAVQALEVLKSRLSTMFVIQEEVDCEQLRQEEHQRHCTLVASVSFGRVTELDYMKDYIFPVISEETNQKLEAESTVFFNEMRNSTTGSIWKSDIIAYVRKRIAYDEESETDIWNLIVHACPTVRTQHRELDDWEFAALYNFLSLWSHTLVVTAEDGAGKTSLLCQASAMVEAINLKGGEMKRVDTVVYFPGICAGSVNMALLVNRIAKSITGEMFTMDTNMTSEGLHKQFLKLFAYSYLNDKKIVIIIDDVHRLSALPAAQEGVQTLSWLPLLLPPNVKIVVSIPFTNPSFVYINERLAPESIYRLPPIGFDCSSKLALNYLARYGITLTDSQLVEFLSKPMAAANPFYLQEACEELRLMGSLDVFEQEVLCLPHDLPNLHYWKIDRVVEQGGVRMFLMLCLLDAAWPNGLNEVALLQLLGNTGTLEEILTDPWPGGVVHKCTTLDAFFSSTHRRVKVEILPANTCYPPVGVVMKKAPLRRAHTVGEVSQTSPESENFNGPHLRRAQSDGEMGSVDDDFEKSFRSKERAMDTRSRTSTSNNRKHTMSYCEFAEIMKMLAGVVGIVERNGTVNFLRNTFQQAVRHYCVLLEEDVSSGNDTVPPASNSHPKKIMRRQSSLDRKYFSSNDHLIFKRNLSYFKELLHHLE